MAKTSEGIRPVTYMKTHSSELIRSVTNRRSPVIITQNGEPKVVVQDIESFESDRKLLLLLKLISQGVMDAEAGRVTDHDALFDRLERKYAKKLAS